MARGTKKREADVAIVGAGLAGLTAARRLVGAGLDPLVLEARDRVGGRTLNHEIGDGKVVEVGGQWVGPTQRRMLALSAELGVETFPTHDEGDNLIEWRGDRKRYRGAIPRINPAILADVGQAQVRLDRMARRVPLEAPWEADRAADWDAQTFATWLRRNVATAGARTLFEIAVEAVWAQEPSDLSLLHVLFYTHSGGGFDSLIGTSGGAQQDRFVGGSQLVSLRVAEALGEDRLALEAPVRRIGHGADGVTVTADGLEVRARRAIVALPPTLAGRIAYDPPLPAYRDQLTQRMAQGTVIKCMAVYADPFWRGEGLTGQGTSDVGPVRVTFDNSPPDGTPGVLLGFLEGRQARALGRRGPEERRDAVVGCFTRMFGPRAASPDAYVERVWADEEWTRGCYGCAMPTGAWTEFGPALRAPIGPLHWAGAETATVWSGYMDGAVSSGERAAADIVAALGA
ncbi:MAG TPA: flavin monoamine oxidase family protein [Solirubrobacteraceae bacterium]|nr:flavin monoamine oxidase family protein [Solirubrobacteraceae bacterium]